MTATSSGPNGESVGHIDYAGGGGWYKDTVKVSFSDNGDVALADRLIRAQGGSVTHREDSTTITLERAGSRKTGPESEKSDGDRG